MKIMVDDVVELDPTNPKNSDPKKMNSVLKIGQHYLCTGTFMDRITLHGFGDDFFFVSRFRKIA